MNHIKNTYKLYKLDWQRLFTNPVAAFLIVALMIIPSLYAWFNIKALWDPYANTGELPIAVYSNDQGASINGLEVTIGEEVIKNLHENKELGWRFVHSKKELDEGVKSGKYFAGIYLPKDFSKDLLSFTTGEINKPKIEYSVNEKINAIAPKITGKGASSLQEQISQEFIKTASNSLISVFNEVGYDLDSNLLSINKVKNMILSTDEDIEVIDGYTTKVTDLYGKLPELKGKLAQANAFIDYLPQVDELGNKVVALNKKLPIIKEQAKAILTLQQKIPEIQSAGEQIAMIDEDFTSIEQTLSDGIVEAKQGLQIIQGVQNTLPDIQKMGLQANQLATTTAAGAKELQNALPSITSSVKVTLEAIKSMTANVSSIAGDIQQMLADGDLTPEERIQLKQLLQEFAESLGKQQIAAEQLATMLAKVQEEAGTQDLQSMIDQLTQISTLLKELKIRVENIDVDSITTEQLQSFLDNLQTAATEMNTIASGIHPEAIATTVNEILSQLLTSISTAKGLLDKAQKIDLNRLLDETGKTVTNGIAILEKYQKQLPAIKQEVHDANLMLNGNMDTIIKGINQGANLYTNELPVIEQKLGLAAAFIQNDYPGIRKDLTSTLDTVNGKMPDLEAALNQANDLIKNDWPAIKIGLHKAADAIRKGEDQVDLGEVIKLLKLDATKESDFFTQPVEVSEKRVYPVANNGSASTPFYTALCLWVGAVLLSSVLTTDYHLGRAKKQRFSKREQFVARMLTFMTVGVAQALIVTIGNYYLLGVEVKAPFFSVVFAILIALTFMIMVYVLAGLFGNVGKGLAIIILVLSISGGGGNYPIQVSGKFFQFINPLLPFTHAVNLLRESAGGIYWPNAWHAIIILTGIIIVFSVIGTIAAPYITEKVKKIEEIAHESQMFH